MKKKTKIENPRLKMYLGATKHDPLLLGHVDQYLQRLTDDRDATVIHPSEMSDKNWCPRATWLRLSGASAKKEPLGLRTNLIFSEGHQIHAKWQGWLKDMGILWGAWRCRVCGEYRVQWSNMLSGRCYGQVDDKTHIWEYHEVPLDLPTCRIGGHADGIVSPSPDESVLLEVKSIGPGTLRLLDLLGEDESDELSSERFSRITRPLASHFIQTQLYLRLAGRWAAHTGQITRALVIYEHKADQQVREFVVTRNDRWTDPLISTASDIVWAIDNDRPVVCPFGGCAKCRSFEEQ